MPNENALKIYKLSLNAVMAILVWFKIGSFIMVTKSFGVYIWMIIMMIKVIFNFMIIYGAFLLCCSLIFCSFFYNENKEFWDYSTSLSTLLNASFGNFSLEFFSERTTVYGRIIYEIYIAFSAIFLFNMIIAVLSNVYQALTAQIDADYNTNLILAYFKMEWEPRYGMLIFAPAPLNIVALLMTPFLLLV